MSSLRVVFFPSLSFMLRVFYLYPRLRISLGTVFAVAFRLQILFFFLMATYFLFPSTVLFSSVYLTFSGEALFSFHLSFLQSSSKFSISLFSSFWEVCFVCHFLYSITLFIYSIVGVSSLTISNFTLEGNLEVYFLFSILSDSLYILAFFSFVFLSLINLFVNICFLLNIPKSFPMSTRDTITVFMNNLFSFGGIKPIGYLWSPFGDSRNPRFINGGVVFGGSLL